ncbi:16S rRNA (cytosine(1402)-N(4))-methyltransferase RsmH [Campylobacter canadensis]|uniref:16S rRNA (cytosine(1402)-N(4))-methyltransferase RsmH n=1 Tax=Campylobacter canadensis TaxID=449520 RepID=UPI001554634D|nr:16S rRNA (cytosine(1402)-N(4))-methyltransferase RsmH [Campylobacter canadensis]MBZ7996086.1 16S rRNA (cytosine(1402)-N(4))-methyltransferase RsmH [Campylobacter canadensis]MBZ7999722.1 16S rRNA (cytosine(1402)-N(4))-methyltransferase RsmH [Campylobacter canadensis]MBZ8001517.1 16S rRNA (cytosine(1402)-N(4))-methyltransferase RsmH [Campylobacter canadensis]MBZ8003909.1 16S rRNA (cytosine(1402)-N(4))-methyltransferase RsmH [Campylobacter canadensis]
MHIPVLKNEVLEIFKNINSGIFIDATLGYAGHSKAILEQNNALKLIACDQDEFAILNSKKNLSEYENRFKIFHTNYENIINYLSEDEVKNTRAILADIGVSSVQLDYDERGFSFTSSKLDMRMNKNQELDAFYVVNNYSLKELTNILINYAEFNEKLASDIAKNIITKRPINSALELSNIIGDAKLNSRSVSLKTLVFQAIRIEVNKELDVLKNFLKSLEKLQNCYVLIISFHSLEDKIVKEYFKKWSLNCICPEYAIRCECSNNNALGKIITKKPIIPSKEEIKSNSRSSCAKLRVFYIK